MGNENNSALYDARIITVSAYLLRSFTQNFVIFCFLFGYVWMILLWRLHRIFTTSTKNSSWRTRIVYIIILISIQQELLLEDDFNYQKLLYCKK